MKSLIVLHQVNRSFYTLSCSLLALESVESALKWTLREKNMFTLEKRVIRGEGKYAIM